jgi:Ca2+-binding RTX toxin-like protein
MNDTIYGGDGDDVILGDNGEILRQVDSIETDYPWTVHVWKRYPLPFQSETIRDVRRYDDIDFVQGNDLLNGDEGNDIIHGQRGDDLIYGNEGDGKSC